jgi:large subunit ribosomal protein L14
MIQEGTLLNVADNSGVKRVKCIKVLGGSRKRFGIRADRVVVSVREVIPKAIANNNSSIKKGDVFQAVIVRTKSAFRRDDGTVIKFDENAVVLIDKQEKLIGTRVFGIVPRELKKDFFKITTLVKEVI